MTTIPQPSTLTRWVVEATDHSGEPVGWVDHDGHLTMWREQAAPFPTKALADAVRRSRFVRRHTVGLALRTVEVA